jgi:hypothetical protein
MEMLHNLVKTGSDVILLLYRKFVVTYLPIFFFLSWYRQPAYIFGHFFENV